MIASALNIGHVFCTASDEQMVSGLNWYGEANALCHLLDPSHPERAAGVISSLSPQAGWAANKKWAIQTYEAGTGVGNTTANRDKATRCLNGEPLETVFATAPKTRNFAFTIADPTCDAVVVDRHAFSVAVGYWVSPSESAKVLGRKGEYDRIADLYRDAASVHGVLVSEIQAVTWVTFRHDVEVGAWNG